MSITKSGAGIAVALTLVLSMVVGVASTSAMTTSELINLLIAAGVIAPDKVAAVQAIVGGQTTTTTSGYVFNTNLTVGSRGADVTALQNAVGVSPATGYFGAITKAAVIQYQIAKGITPAAGYVGAITRAALNAGGSVVVVPGTPVPTGTSLNVTLAATSPMAGSLVAGSAISKLVEYTFTNTSATPAVVTNVTLARTGISSDTDLSNVYLYSGVTRLTDAATISSGRISFNAPAGLFTIPAGSSKTVAVRADVITGFAGQVGISLTGVTSNVAVAASYPISGALFTGVTPSSITTVVFTATTTPAATDVDPQSDYVMWQNTIQVSNHDAALQAITLRQIGSVAGTDLANFKLFVDGSQVASIAALGTDGYLVFDLSSNPLRLTQTSHIVKLVGDVVGGSTKNFSFSMRRASDISIVDTQLGVNVTATASATAGSTFPITGGVQTITGGSLTITKKTDSPSGNVTLQGSALTLARFEIKATGEPMKVETLNVRFAPSDVNVSTLRNGMLFANGSQIGSTADISSSSAGTQFNLGSSLVVYPGSPAVIEVKADIYDNTGTNDMTNGDTFTVSLVAGSQNVQKLVSLSYVGSSAVSANQLTVAQGSLSVSKYSGYANKSVVVPQTAYKLGEYVLSTNSTEDVNLNTLSVYFNGTGASSTISNVSDVYVVYGTKQTSSKSSVVAGENSYSINEVLRSGASMNVAVYGTVSVSSGASDVYATKLAVSGQTVQSGQTASSSIVTGQTVAVTTGSLAVTKDASSPATDLIAAGTGATAKVASFKFEAQNDEYTITDLAVGVAAASAGNVSSFTLKNGSTIVKENQSLDSVGVATSTGVSFVIPAGTSKILDVYANLSAIGTNNATTSSNIQVTLSYFKKQSSTGVQTEVSSTATTSNALYVFKSKPTVTVASLPSTLLANGTKTLAKFNVRADAAGSIAWGTVSIAVSKTVGRAALTNIKLYDDATGIEVAGTMVGTTTLAATTTTSQTLVFTPTTEEQVGAGATKTYSLKATVAIDGELVAGNNVTTSITSTGGAAASTVLGSVGTSSFKWSDMSVSGHSTATADWNTDYLVKDMASLDTQSISY